MIQATTQPFTLTYCLAGCPKSAVALDYGEVLIGRASDCQVIIEDAQASRRHAALSLQPEGIRLRDLGSHNGTFVSGKRLPPHAVIPLRAGQPFYIGAVEFSVLGRGTPVPPPQPGRMAGSPSRSQSAVSNLLKPLTAWRSRLSLKWLLLILLVIFACLLAGVGGVLILWGSQPQHIVPAGQIPPDWLMSLILSALNAA